MADSSSEIQGKPSDHTWVDSRNDNKDDMEEVISTDNMQTQGDRS